MSDPLRILMLVLNATGRGTYWRAYHLGRHLARQDHAVTILAMSPSAHFRLISHQTEGMIVVETPDLFWGPLRSGWDPWNSLRRILYLRGREYDLIHAFECRPTVLFPTLWLHQRGVPLVMDWGDWFGRGGLVEERPNPLIRAVLRPVETFFEERFRTLADGTVAICTTLVQKAIRLGIDPKTILLLRDGADTEGVRALDQDQARLSLGLPVDTPVIGYIGNISPKDARLMTQAFEQIHAVQPTTRLFLIGYMNAPIERMLTVPEAVIRTGVLPYHQINAWISACDIGWLPYVNSGANQGRWPLKFNDYMAAGKPTLATAVGDVPLVMEQYQVGVLAQPEVGDLARKALELLADREKRRQLGKNALHTAAHYFDWRFRAAELEDFYRQVIQSAHRKTLAFDGNM